MSQKEVDDKYKKHELRDHIYQLPDTYIGSVEASQIESYVYNPSENCMNKKTLTYVPGLFKIYDEIVVNALDHAMRLKDEIKKGKKDVKPVKTIQISIDKTTGYIEVTNDGDGIDVEKHSSYDMYIPQLIFGELLTSTNYDQDMEKLWGGKNGYGSKLTNIFSKEFIIETVDHRRERKYTQRFSDNMKKVDKPTIKSNTKSPYTKIRFLPDYARFGLKGITQDIYDLFHKRAIDACATTDVAVTIYFNDKKVDVKNFEKYVDLYVGSKDTRPRAMEACAGDRWEVIATYSDGQFEQVSFVNGINTSRGGKHIEYITGQITKRLGEMVASKTKKEVKAQHIKDNLAVFVKCLVVNPSFDTQTKDALTTPSSKFGSKCELSDKFMTALYKTGLIEKAISLTEFHQEKKVAKTDGKKTNRIIVPKLDDANWAGTKNSQECTLILTEGDSAKTMAIAGLSIVGRDKYGVFPLRGKILNAKEASLTKIAENEEITSLKKILGLQQGKTYADLSQLRYGKIMLMTDQDDDGFHIKGLLFNLFESLWPSLYKMEGFLTSMRTPIVKVTHVEGETVSFYNLPDYEKWKDAKEKSTKGLNGWKIKYYKGLGTSKESEAKEYFSNMKITTYHYNLKTSDESLDLAFNKKRADDRKDWLMKYNRNNVLDYKNDIIPYEEFVHKELIHFSNRDVERSISCMCDGFKESNRKIIFGCLKRKLFKGEIKVAQLAAYISEVSAYHHGETSLQQAITGMAQVYVGANNMNLLQPNGQFGTRIQGGKDSASPRYIYTILSKVARALFRDEDLPILEYQNDDGLDIEPTYYIPIIPLVLINGAIGIGTGFSTNVPCHNPSDIIEQCETIINKLNTTDTLSNAKINTSDQLKEACSIIGKTKLGKLIPWYLGFQGQIIPYKEGTFVSRGKYTWIDDQTIEIQELPIGTWTEDYKDYLEGMVANGSPVLKDFENHYTSKNVKFILKLYPGVRSAIEKDFEIEFKLVTSKNLSLNNIHLYTEQGAIKKYKDTSDVVRDWAQVRLTKYFDRKKYQLNALDKQYTLISAKVRFIQDIISNKITIMNKKIKEVNDQLTQLKYPTLAESNLTGNAEKTKSPRTTPEPPPDADEESADAEPSEGVEIVAEKPSYTYLTRMPIHQLTFEKKRQLEKEAEGIKMLIEDLRAKPIQKIWYDELQELKAVWLEHKQLIEEEYELDRQTRPTTASSSKKKK
jgi:DNA topoisomerase-2